MKKKNINLLKYLEIIKTESAKYYIGDEVNLSDIGHIGLNIKFYTHFTSPIRRYIDILVHRCLSNALNITNIPIDKSTLKNICTNSNTLNKNIKRARRDYDKLSLINILKENSNEINTNCYIINFKENRVIDIFIEEYNISHRFNLYSEKLDNIIKYLPDNDTLIIKNKQNNKILKLYLYQEIKININSLILSDTFDNKIKITITEPDVFYLLDIK